MSFLKRLFGQAPGDAPPAPWEALPPPARVAAFLSAPKSQVRAAAPRLEAELAALGASELVALDRSCRQDAIPAWLQLKPEQLERIQDFASPSSAQIAGLLSCHPRGQLRQEALKLLARCPSGQGLPFVLLRLNDWAEAVRAEAQKALEELSARLGPAEVPRVAPLLLRLREGRRADHGPQVLLLVAALARIGNREALLSLFRSADTSLRRGCFELALAHPLLPREQLLELGMGDRDPLVRAWVLERGLGVLPEEAREPWLKKAAEDRSVMVQFAALRWAENRPEMRDRLLRRLMWSTRASVRDYCIQSLEKLAPGEALAAYRAELAEAEGHNVPAALLGLSALGKAEDMELVRPRLASPRAEVQKAALLACTRLDGGDKVLLLSRLQSPEPGVSRLACELLLSSREVPLLAEDLSGIFQASPLRHVRLNTWRLTTRIPRWKFPEFLGSLPKDLDEEQQARGAAAIQRWVLRLNRGGGPSSRDLDRVRLFLAAARRRWPDTELAEAERFLG